MIVFATAVVTALPPPMLIDGVGVRSTAAVGVVDDVARGEDELFEI